MKYKCLQTGSKGNCSMIWTDDKCIILDAGIQMQRIKDACQFQLEKIDFGLVTHWHVDHSLSLRNLLDHGINVIHPPVDDWEAMATSGYQNLRNMGDWLVKWWEVEHDCLNWAFLLYHKQTHHKIAYITDFSHTKLVPANVDTLIVECSYIDEIIDKKQNELGDRYLRLKQYHMSLARLLKLLESMQESPEYRLKNIIVVHLSDRNSNKNDIIGAIKEKTGIDAVIADKGTEVEL